MSGRTKLLSKRARKLTLWVHVLSSSLWLGSAVAMVVLLLAKWHHLEWASVSESVPLVYGILLAVKLIDDYVIIGSCGVSALSGMLLSWKTPWGFFNYWWVAVKFVITLLLLLSGASLLGPWINASEELARARLSAPVDEQRLALLDSLVSGLGGSQVLILGFLMFASTYKPWGKIARAPRHDDP